MVFSIGTKVRLKHTGDVGKITAILLDGMVQVHLTDDDMEIPVAEEFLERYEVASSTKAKIVQGKQSKKPESPPELILESQYAILKSHGIQLAFDPQYKADGTTESFDLYLLNDTQKAVIYTFEISFLNGNEWQKNGKLNPVTAQHIGNMHYDLLNDAPIVQMEAWVVTTQGTGTRLFQEVKIKPKQFFKKITTAPFLNRSVHLYRIIEKFEKEEKPAEEDLKTYTNRHAMPYKKSKKSNVYNQIDVQAFADFETEIDLHIENIAPSNKKRSNREISELQLRAFHNYIEKAIRLGVERVFVIHGVGEGKLKNKIGEYLIKNPFVRSFKNEYHPRYGFGATEVLF